MREQVGHGIAGQARTTQATQHQRVVVLAYGGGTKVGSMVDERGAGAVIHVAGDAVDQVGAVGREPRLLERRHAELLSASQGGHGPNADNVN